MNQILTIVLAIIMAFSSAGSMTATIEDTVSFDAKVSMDPGTLMMLTGAAGTEESQQMVKVIGDIMDAVSLRGVMNKETAELDLMAGEDIAVSIGVKTDEKGSTVASSLLGNSVIFASAEFVQSMQQQAMSASSGAAGIDPGMMEQLQNLDKEQIAKDVTEVGEKLAQAFEAKKGETEAGEFTVDGMTFTGRTPVNMTYTEFIVLLLTSVKELAAKESLKPLFQMTGTDVEAEIDKVIESENNMPEEAKPQLELAVYTDADNCAYYICDMVKAAVTEGAADERMYFALGEVDSLVRIHCVVDMNRTKMEITSSGKAEGPVEMNLTIDDGSTKAEFTATEITAGIMDMTVLIRNTGMEQKLVIHTEPTEGERTSFDVKFFMGNAEQPMFAITGTAGKGGEITSIFEGDKITVIPIETLMNSTDESSASTLRVQMLAGLLKAVTVLTKNVPEETASWINTQVAQMMNPAPAATAAPQEAPAGE